MTNHHNTALAKKTAAVTAYEASLKTKTDLVAAKKELVATAMKEGEAAAKAAGTTVMPADKSKIVTDA